MYSSIMIPFKIQRRVFAVAIGVIILTGFIALMRDIMLSPARGTPTSKTLVSAQSNHTATEPLVTPYYELQVPLRYAKQANVPTPAGLLDTKQFIGRLRSGSGSSQLAISVKKLTVEGLSGDSAFRSYTSRPQSYTIETETYKAMEVAIANKQTGSPYEVVAFCPYKDKLMTIALSAATATKGELYQDMQELLEGLSWK